MYIKCENTIYKTILRRVPGPQVPRSPCGVREYLQRIQRKLLTQIQKTKSLFSEKSDSNNRNAFLGFQQSVLYVLSRYMCYYVYHPTLPYITLINIYIYVVSGVRDVR